MHKSARGLNRLGATLVVSAIGAAAPVGAASDAFANNWVLEQRTAFGYKVIHDFQPNPGAEGPVAGLILASDGNFYGTTQSGGSGTNCSSCGTVYKMTPQGTVTVIHSFSHGEGSRPDEALVEGPDGALYGATNFDDEGLPGGTIYRVTKEGALTVLHTFTFDAGGYYPSELIVGPGQRLYGILSGGGAHDAGAVFRIALDGSNFKTLFNFDPSSAGFNGQTPSGALLFRDGHLWGTTGFGGRSDKCTASLGCGTVYEMDKKGTVLSWYSLYDDAGQAPFSGVIAAPDGSLYGTATQGGNSDQCRERACGTVFRLKAGRVSAFHKFSGADGQFPLARLVMASDGNLYGSAYYGGIGSACSGQGCGTLFQLTQDGGFSLLHKFKGGPKDGGGPSAPLVQGNDGTLFGTTFGEGAKGAGVTFTLDLP